MATAGAPASITKENRRASRDSEVLGSHSHGEDTRGEGRHIPNMYRVPERAAGREERALGEGTAGLARSPEGA